ncbi:MAG: hypothetical protein UDM12_08735 [Prevotellamassilia sp.]|nr:hypothetical protein [Prevotellamassilia sp.]
MRKITSILSMFLLIAGWNTASAQFAFKKFKAVGDQVTQLSQLVDGHYYVFKNQSKGKYIKLDKGTMQFLNDKQLTEADNSDGLAVFKLHVDESTGTKLYSFESAREGYYMPKVGKGSSASATEATSATAAKFVISATDKNNKTKENCWAIKNSADDYYFDMQDGQFVGWDGTESQTWYEISEVTLSEVETDLQIVYKVVTKGVEGEVASTTYGIATTGTQCPVPNTSYYFSVTQPNDLTIKKDNNSFEFNLTKGETPFTAGQWYSLRINNYGSRILRAVAEDNNLYVNTESGSDMAAIADNYTNFLNALWRIEESGYGVKIYNKGTGKYLKTNGDGTEKANRVSFDNTGTVFYVIENGDGLAFYTGSGNGYLNACCKSAGAGTENYRLGVWNDRGSSTDAGSRLLFEVSDLEHDLLYYGKKAFAATTDGNFYTNDNALKKGGNYWKYKSSVDEATTLNELFNATDNVNPVGAYPETDVYYLIRNVNQGAIGTGEDQNKYLSSEYMFCDTEGKIQTEVGTVSNDRNIKRTKGNSALLPRLWKFEQTSEGKYYLLNVNTNRYVSLNGNLDVPTDQYQGSKTAFSLEATNVVFGSQFNATNDATTMFLMGANNTFVNAQNGMGKYNGVASYADKNDGGNYWQFIKVTVVPLTIAANDYTTLCLPFNVKLPENSAVKAYYASAAAGEVLKLEEITNGIIPANEGVILQNTNKSEVANINLTITAEEATLTDNKLKGVTAKREGYDALSNYVLADKNGTTGFYKAKFTAIVANKAYLPVANVQNAQGVMMAFSFGDEVTGIDNVNAAAPAAKKYYDLQGRRVLYPAKGIFVTEDGQKVLFK